MSIIGVYFVDFGTVSLATGFVYWAAAAIGKWVEGSVLPTEYWGCPVYPECAGLSAEATGGQGKETPPRAGTEYGLCS